MLAIRVLGTLAIEAGGETLELPARRHGQLLVGYLALNPGMHARLDVARLLWPGVLESSARSSLRSALSSVRHALGAHAGAHLRTDRARVGLADVWVDAREFRALAERGKLDQAAELGRGPLLQGLDGEWVEQAREEHRERLAGVLEALASAAEARGDLERAIAHTRELVALDPLAEPPNRELIRRLAAAGDRASALAVYRRLSEGLRSQLRLAPSLKTREVAEAVRAGDEAVRWTPPPLQAALRVHAAARLLGRSQECEQLRGALAAAVAGDPQTVLVAGEPGIGKTALLAQFAAAVGTEAAVFYGRCVRDSPGVAAPFVEALRHYAAETPPERILRELPPGAAELARLVPELAVEPPASGSALQIGETGRGVRALVETVLAIAREHPLVFVVDDLHEADQGTLSALAQLAAVPRPAGLVLVIAYRDTADAPIADALRRLRRLPSTRSIVLGPLAESEIAELAAVATGSRLPADRAAAVHRRSGGNPLFAEELARRAEASPDAGPLPERVTDLILDELAGLAPSTREVLASAAALGDEFELATAAAVCATTTDRCLDALDAAVTARAVRELPGTVGRYQFRHALVRETLYAGLSATRRAQLHVRAADCLERRGAPARDVAEQLAKAHDLAPRNKLAEYTLRAAKDDEAVFAHDDAAALYARAVALAADGSAERCERLIALGHARRRAGETGAARDAFTEATRLARTLGDTTCLAEAALGACAIPDFAAGQQVDRGAVDLLEEALEAVPPVSEALRSRLLAQLAAERHFGGERAEIEEVVELARGSGDADALGAVLDVAHMVRRGDGDPHERLRIAEEMLRVARAAGDREREALAHVRRCADLFELGDFDGVRAEREALAELAGVLRQPAYLWFAKLWRATEAIFEGSPDGERLSREAYKYGRVQFGDAAELELSAQAYWLLLEHGRLADREREIRAALEPRAALPAVRCALARLDAEVGRDDDAGRALADLSGPGLDALRREAGWPINAALLAELCARVGDSGAAARLAAAIDPDRWATSAFGSLCLGPLSGSLALVCAVAGSRKAAVRHRDAALAACEAAGAVPAAARLEREYALAAGALPARAG